MMPNAADENALAHNMIEVHGIEAAGIARANARADALSRDSLIIQRMVHSLSVEVCDGLVNASVEVIS